MHLTKLYEGWHFSVPTAENVDISVILTIFALHSFPTQPSVFCFNKRLPIQWHYAGESQNW